MIQRLKRALLRLKQGPDFGTEDWIRDWEKRRVFRMEDLEGFDLHAAEGYEVLPAAETLPDETKDELDAPSDIERAVCVDDPRCCLYVRRDGAVFPCEPLARADGESFGRLGDERPDEIWGSEGARRYRDSFAERTRIRDHVFFRYIGGSRTLYLRSLRLAAEEMPPPPEPCRTCPKLMPGSGPG
jgi:hypothetical protein